MWLQLKKTRLKRHPREIHLRRVAMTLMTRRRLRSQMRK